MAKKRKRKVKLGGRLRPIKAKARKGVAIEVADKPPEPAIVRVRARPTARQRNKTLIKARKTKRGKGVAAKRERARERLITVEIEAKPPQSIRGSFIEGTEEFVDSVIIHLILYDAPKRQLYVQLTAAGHWRHYTYHNVPLNVADAFEKAPSKGRFFNKNIRNSQKWGFNYRFSRGSPIASI